MRMSRPTPRVDAVVSVERFYADDSLIDLARKLERELEQMEIAARNLYEYECEFAREAGINERRWTLLDRLWATFTKPDASQAEMSREERWAGMLRLADEMGISVADAVDEANRWHERREVRD